MKTRHARRIRNLILDATADYRLAGYPRQGWQATHPAYSRTWSRLEYVNRTS